MQDYSQLIHASLEWATTVCFRPFKFKKWLILGLVAVMAGYASGFMRFNLPSGPDQKQNKDTRVLAAQTAPSTADPAAGAAGSSAPTSPRPAAKPEINALGLPIIGIGITALIFLALGLIVLFMWLNARFVFVFTEGVTKNRAAIKLPFAQYKKTGNSLFYFNLAFSAIYILLLFILVVVAALYFVRAGIFNGAGTLKTIFACVFFGLPLIFLVLASAIISVLTKDFISVVMFKDNINVMPAWKKLLDIIDKNRRDIFIYFLARIGLVLLSGLIFSVLYLAGLCGMALTFIPLIFVLVSIFRMLPELGQVIYIIILLLPLVAAFIFLLYCSMCSYLPFAVFLRTFSIKFLARLEPRYNIFTKEVTA